MSRLTYARENARRSHADGCSDMGASTERPYAKHRAVRLPGAPHDEDEVMAGMAWGTGARKVTKPGACPGVRVPAGETAAGNLHADAGWRWRPIKPR
jgi:hypothetical protein